MRKFKCKWNVNATAEEYPANIPSWLPEYTVEASDQANALYKYEHWLCEIGKHPSPKYFKSQSLEQYLSKEYASGGWGLFATEIK